MAAYKTKYKSSDNDNPIDIPIYAEKAKEAETAQKAEALNVSNNPVGDSRKPVYISGGGKPLPTDIDLSNFGKNNSLPPQKVNFSFDAKKNQLTITIATMVLEEE